MKARLFYAVSLILVAALIVCGGPQRAMAQGPQSPAGPAASKGQFSPPDLSGLPDRQRLASALPQATGGPDDYGYTWDDSVAFNWIDATAGVDSGVSGDDQASAAVDIGFPFRFYENTYSQLYFNTNGLVTFGASATAYANTTLPMQAPPNNLIGVFWTDLTVGEPYNTGKIYCLRGGAAPNRYLVLEWYDATPCCSSGSTDYRTFEVILRENGDIVTQWLSLSGNLESATVGIEDAFGVSGLAYVYNSPGVSDGKAVRFLRPGPMARVQVYPLYLGQLSHAGQSLPFEIPVRNTGDLGNDIYDVTVSSTWPLLLYHADGVTPLTDTDSDGTPDSGAVSEGSTQTIVARIQVPGGAGAGDGTMASVTVRSSLDTAKSRTVTLQTAVPAPFVQVYRDDYDGTMSLYLAQPGGQQTKEAAPGWWGYHLAVTEAPNGDFVYFWDRPRCVGSGCNVYVREIEFTLLNRYGETVRGTSKLTDHSQATVDVYDFSPAVVAAPDGHIGVLWYSYSYRYLQGYQYNYNVFFAILDAAGQLTYGPLNVTNNAAWGNPWSTPDVPSFDRPQVAATGDNRFVLAWQEEHEAAGCSSGDCTITDIYYAVRDSSGNAVRAVTRFTNDTPGGSSESYYSPSLTALAGNRALLTWARYSNFDVYYAVLDSAGNVVKGQTNLSTSGQGNYDADAVQLDDGKIVVAWAATWKPKIHFAVLDPAYNRIAGPTALSNPPAVTGDWAVSVAAAAGARAVLTWMDYDYYSQRNLYYALVDGSGSILTQPTIFRTSEAAAPRIDAGSPGHGNTSYRSPIAAGVDGAVWAGADTVGGAPGGTAAIGVRYANHGQTPATGVVLTATLGGGLTYLGDSSGIGPSVAGNVVTWDVPGLAFLEMRQFTLFVGVPASAPVGSHHMVALALAANEADANAGDNSADVDVVAASRVYLPLVRR